MNSRLVFGIVLVTLTTLFSVTYWNAVTHAPTMGVATGSSTDRTDAALFAGILTRLRNGEPYYEATADEMLARGYQHSSFLNFRLPTLAVVEASLPSIWIARVALIMIGVAAAWLFHARVPASAVDLRLITLAIGATMLPVWFLERSVYMHEIWAGALIALSLALWTPDRSWPAVVTGLIAGLIRELAVLYLVAMFLMAVLSSRKRESLAWLLVIVAAVVALAIHGRMTSPFVAPGVENGWIALGGPAFVIQTWRANLVALVMPAILLVFLTPATLTGIWFWRHTAATRAAITVVTFALLFLVVGRPDNWYWGFLIAPIWPFGLIGCVQAVGALRPDHRTHRPV